MTQRIEIIKKLAFAASEGMMPTIRECDATYPEVMSAIVTLFSAQLEVVLERTNPADWIHNKTELLRVIQVLRDQVDPPHVH